MKRFLVTLVVLGLAGSVLFLLSQLNARTFSVELRQGKLVVMKGRLLPTGSEPFQPSDAALADAYAPLDPAGTVPYALFERRFVERDELDRALFEVIEALAKPRVTSDDPKLLEAGLYYLRRAERLAGLTEEQRLSVKVMQSEVAYYQARSKLDEAQRLISESMVQLKVAASSRNRNSHSANQMILAIEPPTLALQEALRSAVHGLSAPANLPAALPPAAVAPTVPTSGETAPEAAAPPPGAPLPDAGALAH